MKTILMTSALVSLTVSCLPAETNDVPGDSKRIAVVAEFDSEATAEDAMVMIDTRDDGSFVVAASAWAVVAELTPEGYATVAELSGLRSLVSADDELVAGTSQDKNEGCFLEYVDCVSGDYYNCLDMYLICMEP